MAKSILLRPGNASLESIRVLIQETVIEANTEDKAVGSYIRKIRESAFMTKEELKAWKESAAKDAKEEEEEEGRVRGRRHAGWCGNGDCRRL